MLAATPKTPPFKMAFSRKEVAALLGICVKTVDRHISEGRLPSFVLGGRRLISRHSLENKIGRIPY